MDNNNNNNNQKLNTDIARDETNVRVIETLIVIERSARISIFARGIERSPWAEQTHLYGTEFTSLLYIRKRLHYNNDIGVTCVRQTRVGTIITSPARSGSF